MNFSTLQKYMPNWLMLRLLRAIPNCTLYHKRMTHPEYGNLYWVWQFRPFKALEIHDEARRLIVNKLSSA